MQIPVTACMACVIISRLKDVQLRLPSVAAFCGQGASQSGLLIIHEIESMTGSIDSWVPDEPIELGKPNHSQCLQYSKVDEYSISVNQSKLWTFKDYGQTLLRSP